MKKPIITYLLLFFILFCSCANAFTITKQCNLPRPGDFLDITVYDGIAPGKSGNNICWDFSQATVASQSETLKFTGTLGKLITAKYSKHRNYFSVKGDTLLWHGYESRQANLSDSVGAVYMRFPTAFRDSLSLEFDFKGKHFMEFSSSLKGYGSIKADAEGEVILPDGDTVCNVMRICREFIGEPKATLNDLLPEDSPIQNYSVTYREYDWFAEGYRYPIVSLRQTFKSEEENMILLSSVGYIYSPRSQEIDIKDDKPNEETRIKLEQKQYAQNSDRLPSITDITLKDDNDELKVAFTFNGETDTLNLIISDSAGLAYITVPNTKVQQGYNMISIPVASLSSGEYALLLVYGETRISLKFQHR